MKTPLMIECTVHFHAQAKGRKELHPGHAAAPVAPVAYRGWRSCWRWRTASRSCCTRAS